MCYCLKKLNGMSYICKIFKKIARQSLEENSNKTLLDIVYERAKKIFDSKNIIVATTASSDNKISIHCIKNNYRFFRGDLNNVLLRAVSCLKKFKFTSVARICCDRPFFNYKELNLMIKNLKPINMILYLIVMKIFLLTYK